MTDVCFHKTLLKGAGLAILHTDRWTCYIRQDYIVIGCERHMAEDWFTFDDDEISDMDYNALDWWHKWKPAIQAVHESLVKEKDQ